jgi:hypothetical protein
MPALAPLSGLGGTREIGQRPYQGCRCLFMFNPHQISD